MPIVSVEEIASTMTGYIRILRRRTILHCFVSDIVVPVKGIKVLFHSGVIPIPNLQFHLVQAAY